MNQMNVEQLFDRLAAIPQVEAIALGGSRAGTEFDESSDYDVYLYCTAPVPEAIRREILTPWCKVMELGNHFWELEDNCTLINGVDIDILYRDPEAFCQDVASVVEDCRAHNAYTTCMWHNLLTCKILHDRDGRLAAAKARFTVPYPEQLRRNILDNGLRLLKDSLPAYDHQILKAAARGDLVSINHRLAAFMETYFDVLFALNRQTHPGEKRLISLARKTCALLPDHFESNLQQTFDHAFTSPERLSADLASILTELEKIVP